MFRYSLIFVFVVSLCAACADKPKGRPIVLEPRPSPTATVLASKPEIGMGVSEFHDICGGVTDGMELNEAGETIMPFKPREGRKPECVGRFTFTNYKLTKIEPIATGTK